MPYLNIYTKSKNACVVALEDNGIPVNLNNVVRMKVITPLFTVDSREDPNAFDWSEGYGMVSFRFGGLAHVAPGQRLARLIVYDQTSPHGVDFGTFPLNVVSSPTS